MIPHDAIPKGIISPPGWFFASPDYRIIIVFAGGCGILRKIFRRGIMDEISEINLSALESELSPSSFTVFRALYENARNVITKEGTRESYEKPLNALMAECGSNEVEAVANSIREILQRLIECKKGEYLLFLPFLKSICIENGIIKYSLPREIECYMKTSG